MLLGSVSAENVLIPCARDYGEMLEEQRGESAALLRVVDGERDLGFVRANAVVAWDRDDLVTQMGDKRHVIAHVDGRQVLELRGSRRRHRREEPQIARLVREPLILGRSCGSSLASIGPR